MSPVLPSVDWPKGGLNFGWYKKFFNLKSDITGVAVFWPEAEFDAAELLWLPWRVVD